MLGQHEVNVQNQRKNRLINFGIGLIILIIFISVVGIQDIIWAFGRLDPFFVVLGLIIGLTNEAMLGMNWKIVIDLMGYDISFYRLYKLYYAGMFTNNITPLGEAGGEPIMAYILSNNSDMPYEESLAALTSANIVNVFPFFTYTIVGLIYFVLVYPADIFVILVALIVILTGSVFIIFFVLLWCYKGLAKSVIIKISLLGKFTGVEYINKMLDEDMLIEKFDNFHNVLRSVFSDTKSIMEVFVISHAGWFLGILCLYTFLIALNWKIPFSLVMFIVPASGLAFWLPLPGGFGGVEVVMATFLTIIAGVPPSIASAAVILQRGSTYGLTTLIGGFSMWRLSINMFKIDEG